MYRLSFGYLSVMYRLSIGNPIRHGRGRGLRVGYGLRRVGYCVLAILCWLRGVGYFMLATACWLFYVGYGVLSISC